MFSPVFALLENEGAVQALLGNPVRVYSFGEAKQGTAKPYVVHQTIGGTPENYLGTPPDNDSTIVQLDVYAESPDEAKAVVRALLPPIEAAGHVTSWNGEFRDFDTKFWRISFTAEFHDPRT